MDAGPPGTLGVDGAGGMTEGAGGAGVVSTGAETGAGAAAGASARAGILSFSPTLILVVVKPLAAWSCFTFT